MSQYYTLLKNGKIDFSEILLEKYALIGLDEVDCIILIKIKKILDDKKNASESYIISSLENGMSISSKIISEKVLALINANYITLSNDNIGSFTLDDTFKRLSSLYDSEEEEMMKDESVSDLKKAASLIEKECEKLLTPTEIEVIKHWIEVDKYTFNDIKDATLESISHKKKSVKHIDLFLNKNKESKKEVTVNGNDELSELFTQAIYGKKRS